MSDISGQDSLQRTKVVTSLSRGQNQHSRPSLSDTELVRKQRKQKPLQKGQTLLGNFCEVLRAPQTHNRNAARVLGDLNSQDRDGHITPKTGCQGQKSEVKGQLRQTKGTPVVVGKVLSAKLLPGEKTGTEVDYRIQGQKTESEESGRTKQKMTVVGKVLTVVGKVVEKSSLQNMEIVHKSSPHDIKVNQKTSSQDMEIVQKISRPENDSARHSFGVYPMSPPWSLTRNTITEASVVSPKKALVGSVSVRTPTKRKSPCVDELAGTMAVPCKKQKVLAGPLLTPDVL